MGQLKWYKRDPSAALNGMMELSLEERGAYNTVLDLIYSRDGNLPDDDRFIAGWLMVDVRVWKRIKKTLFDRKKLFSEAGLIRNSRADVEVLAALSRVGSAREAGLISAASKAAKSNDEVGKNNSLTSTDVPTGVPTTVPTNHNHNHKEEESLTTLSVREEADRVVNAWNSMARPLRLPACKKITPTLMPSFKARLKDVGLDEMLRAIERIPSSSFLRGERGDWSGANMKFFLRPDKITNILEGNYDDRGNGNQSGNQAGTPAQRELVRRIKAREAEELARSSGRYDTGEGSGSGQLTLEGPSRYEQG